MPTQTYTPSASWNNTSQYQQNGDVSDAAVLQLTGQDALDNIAYLTGGNTNSQVRQEATVADLAALKALTTQRDQDYFVLDSNKRKYQFDSGSAATADDYAVVQPTAGGGRYILINAVPNSTTIRRVQTAVAGVWTVSAGTLTRDPSNGRVSHNGGGPHDGYFEFTDLNAGDVISEIELAGNANVGGGGVNIDANFYLIRANDGDTSPTITALGTLQIAAGAGNTAAQLAAAPLPITIASGANKSKIVAYVTNTTGAPTTVYTYWVALNGTRSYITE